MMIIRQRLIRAFIYLYIYIQQTYDDHAEVDPCVGLKPGESQPCQFLRLSLPIFDCRYSEVYVYDLLLNDSYIHCCVFVHDFNKYRQNKYFCI